MISVKCCTLHCCMSKITGWKCELHRGFRSVRSTADSTSGFTLDNTGSLPLIRIHRSFLACTSQCSTFHHSPPRLPVTDTTLFISVLLHYQRSCLKMLSFLRFILHLPFLSDCPVFISSSCLSCFQYLSQLHR